MGGIARRKAQAGTLARGEALRHNAPRGRPVRGADTIAGGDMSEPDHILIGKSGKPESHKPETLLLRLANRHGLVAGATGTGKTVTLQRLAEGFSNAGVPVFAADIKGDLSGVALPGDSARPFVDRAAEIGIPYEPDDYPVVFWDLFGEKGHPIRATVSEIGPLLLSRLLDLNDTQEGVLNIAFRLADEEGLLLLDLKDLRRSHLSRRTQAALARLRQRHGAAWRGSDAIHAPAVLVLENQGRRRPSYGEPPSWTSST